MKDKLLHAAAWLLLIGYLIWMMLATEWVDVNKPMAAQGEAATNPMYAAQALLRELGATVVKRQTLDELPAPQGRLVLASRHWDLFGDRAQRLRDWVEQGGHLIIPGSLVEHESLEDWLPFYREPIPEPEKKSRAAKKQTKRPKRGSCISLTQSPDAGERYFGERELRVCATSTDVIYVPASEDDDEPLWSLQGPDGIEMLRMPFGRGSVTVVGDFQMLHNREVLLDDNPLALVAALQARRGSDFMFVAEEARDPFMSWIWHSGWVAIVLALLALFAALWRAAVRFGPLARPEPIGRRSMAEQVRGTAAFLRRHGGETLHAAQLRALQESAARRLHRAERSPADEAKAMGSATGIDGAALARALQAHPRNPSVLAADLEVLETARRRLDASATDPRPAPSRTSI